MPEWKHMVIFLALGIGKVDFFGPYSSDWKEGIPLKI